GKIMWRCALHGEPGAIGAAGGSSAGEVAQAQRFSICGGEFHEQYRRDPVSRLGELSLEIFRVEFGNGIGVHLVEAAIVGEKDWAAVSRGLPLALLFALPKMK